MIKGVTIRPLYYAKYTALYCMVNFYFNILINYAIQSMLIAIM